MAARIAGRLNINAEEALRSAGRKFRQRFLAMEEIARHEGCSLSSYNQQKLSALWKQVKN